jgi:hypothetical protein
MHRVHVATHGRENLDILIGEFTHQARCIADRDFGEHPIFDQGHVQPFAPAPL